MTTKMDVRRGIKIEGALPVPETPVLTMVSAPPDEEVQGQFFYSGWTQCPNCQQIGWTTGLNSEAVNIILCAACSCHFWVFPR